MAAPIYEVLNAQGMSLTIFCGGQSNVGIRLFGTWTGTVSFKGSYDGVNFGPLSVTPFASGTAVQSATANGNWFVQAGNVVSGTTPTGLVAVQVVFTTLTTGTVSVAMCASVDSTWQNAFLGASTIFVNSEAAGTNTLTQAAQANRAWNLQELHVSFSGPGAQTAKVIVYDGDKTGTVLWADFVETVAGSIGQRYTVNLPAASLSGSPGVVGTPGNAMTIFLTGVPTTVTTELNAKFAPA